MASDELLALISVFVLLGILFWYLLQRQNSLARARLARAESISRLIEKFATAKEVIEFLQAEQGQKFLEDPIPSAENPRNRALRFIQFGVVFLFVGVGFFLNAYRLSGETDLNYIHQAMDQRFWGMFSVAIGAGLLVAAFVTSSLVKRWGLNGKNVGH